MPRYLCTKPYYRLGTMYQPGEYIDVPEGTPVSKTWVSPENQVLPGPNPVEQGEGEDGEVKRRRRRPSDAEPSA